MAKSAKSRIDNWVARMQGEAVSGNTKRVLDPTNALPTAGTAAYMNATEAMCAREDVVRNYLGEQGVKTILYPWYLAFSRQLFKLENQGYTLNAGKGSPGYLEAATLKEKWTSKGLDPATLEGILGLFT
ncbi:MAG TPA: hypothetical protein VMH22_02670 [bacterium]|nr:hypothetical protein [bacterium]